MTIEKIKTLEHYTILDFIELINCNFDKNVGENSRDSLEWGIWSRDMNIEIKRRINEPCSDQNRILLGLVFAYWVNVSNLLDLLHPRKRGFFEGLFLVKRTGSKLSEAIHLRNHIKNILDENN